MRIHVSRFAFHVSRISFTFPGLAGLIYYCVALRVDPAADEQSEAQGEGGQEAHGQDWDEPGAEYIHRRTPTLRGQPPL
jgi:hypothetical protein